jgi:hypothetical protein
MDQTSRTNKLTLFDISEKARRVAAFIFGNQTKAYYKLSHYFFLMTMFAIGFRNGIRKPGNFFFKRIFFAIKYGFKELESVGVFDRLYHIFPRLDLGSRDRFEKALEIKAANVELTRAHKDAEQSRDASGRRVE